MSNLSVFNFESHEIRFVGTADKPWWVGADICRGLELSNPSMAISKLDDDEKTHDISIPDVTGKFSGSRVQKVWCVNESGVYSLIFLSRKPQAKRFKKWLTSEILPSIRKTGSYASANCQHTTTVHALAELQDAETKTRNNIARLERELKSEQVKLQDIQKQQLVVAKAFNDANPGMVQQAIAVARILDKAKANNKYLSV
ncbi:MAG: BRO family protein [Nostoc sp. S4]|nr:BRO family protein [Nostoc sp. S4]